MKIIRPALLAAGLLLGCGAVAVVGTPALAASPVATPSPAAGNERPAGVILAAKKNKWYYNKHRHGDRRRHRDRHHRHYYDGFYYAAPFWLFAAPYAYNSYYDDDYDYGYDDYDDYDGYGRGDDAHVRWCLNRYRSYDVRSDSFLGYDGDRHRCNSPFD